MKKNNTTQNVLLAAILTFGLIAGTAFAQTGDTAATADTQSKNAQGMMQNKHHGQGMGCKGMMHDKMQKHGKMGMHHGRKMAGNHKGCMGMGMMGMEGMHDYHQDCMAMMDKMTDADHQKFMDQTRDLRKEMMSKRFDYQEMMRNPASTDQQKEQLEKEMETIHNKMMEKMKGFTK